MAWFYYFCYNGLVFRFSNICLLPREQISQQTVGLALLLVSEKSTCMSKNESSKRTIWFLIQLCTFFNVKGAYLFPRVSQNIKCVYRKLIKFTVTWSNSHRSFHLYRLLALGLVTMALRVQ